MREDSPNVFGVLSLAGAAGSPGQLLMSAGGSAQTVWGPLYLDGLWTPGIAGSTTPGTFVYNTGLTKAQYTRIGNRMFFNGRIFVTSTSVAPVGNVSITGFPIASGASTDNGGILGGANISWTGVNLQAGYTFLSGIVLNAVTTMALYEAGDNVARTFVQGGELAGSIDLYFEGSYRL